MFRRGSTLLRVLMLIDSDDGSPLSEKVDLYEYLHSSFIHAIYPHGALSS